ncbi:MAG: glycoside hydrolase family 43 C-terminal domain-containing protein [Paludibacter sp.]|nr:glycoside hydrolase family 43 C-terminal domain-containing protein [Paludibacter sp.]
MKKGIILIILFLGIGLQTKAQQFTENEIIGTWSVLKVQFLNDKIPNHKKQMIEMLKESFLKSKFIFKADHNFTFDFSFDEMRIKNGHWKYNPTTNTILIQDWKDKEKNHSGLMEIFVKKVGDKILFDISETMLSLEMKNENPNR